VNAREWLDEFAARLGAERLDANDFATILDLAGAAARGSGERVAAPAACWVAAVSERSLDEALAVAREIAAEQPPAETP
jgi:hypothetical protein